MSGVTTPSSVPVLTAEVAVFASPGEPPGGPVDEWRVLLIECADEPFVGQLMLPGAVLDPGERFEDAAVRGVLEQTGVDVGELVQVDVLDEPDRDPRRRVITVAFSAVVPYGTRVQLVAGGKAASARWVYVRDVIGHRVDLVLDHQEIVADSFAFVG